jgi:hypothetical protein
MVSFLKRQVRSLVQILAHIASAYLTSACNIFCCKVNHNNTVDFYCQMFELGFAHCIVYDVERRVAWDIDCRIGFHDLTVLCDATAQSVVSKLKTD